MKIIEQRVLRAPSLCSGKPCIVTMVDLGALAAAVSTDLPYLKQDLLALFPGLRGFKPALARGALLAEVIGRVAGELQRKAGATPPGAISCMQARGSLVRIVSPYASEKLAVSALTRAVNIVAALCAGENAAPARRRLPRVRPAPTRAEQRC